MQDHGHHRPVTTAFENELRIDNFVEKTIVVIGKDGIGRLARQLGVNLLVTYHDTEDDGRCELKLPCVVVELCDSQDDFLARLRSLAVSHPWCRQDLPALVKRQSFRMAIVRNLKNNSHVSPRKYKHIFVGRR